MKTLVTLAALAAATILASPATARDADRLTNGEVFVVMWPGNMPHSDQQDDPAVWNSDKFDQAQHLYEACQVQLKHMGPSWLKSVGLTALRNAPGTIVGTALSAPWAFGKLIAPAIKYGKYTTGPALGGSIGAGISGHEYGKRYMYGGCMDKMFSMAHRKGYLKDVEVVINAYPVNGHRLKRPGPPTAADLADDTSAASNTPDDSDAAADSTPPPH